MTKPTRAEQAFCQTVEALCDVLVRRELITEDQHKEVVVRQGYNRGKLLKAKRDLKIGQGRQIQDSISPSEIVVSFNLEIPTGGILSEDRIMQALAEEFDIPYLKIDPLKLDMDLVTKTITHPFAQKHVMVPIALDNKILTVAVDNPADIEGLDVIRRASGYEIKPVLSSRTDISKIIIEFFGFRTSVTAAARELAPTFDIGNLEQYVKMKAEGTYDPSDQPVVNAVEYLLRYAYDQHASDIHVEPKRDVSLVRLRIDGLLHNVHRIPKEVHSAIASRVKMLSRMDIAEKRRPQDGRIKTEHQGKEIELRVSTMPVAFGEKIVIRIFDPDVLLQDLEGLGFSPREFELFKKFISHPHGIILVTGPTGSGKTTTLYSALKVLANPDVNITTIEDPVEMIYEEFNQVSIQPKVDVTFANTLRTILRQDPDIIMVGEIRDLETARNAVQAALTGHLVLSTLHTNDTATAITRLQDLGIENFLISSTIIGIMAQRLTRVICTSCKQKTYLTEEDLRALAITPKEGMRYPSHYGEGCITCRGTGYRGRTGIFEVLEITEKIKRLINISAPANEIKKASVEDGMLTLREGAIKKLGQGITTFNEILRVTTER